MAYSFVVLVFSMWQMYDQSHVMMSGSKSGSASDPLPCISSCEPSMSMVAEVYLEQEFYGMERGFLVSLFLSLAVVTTLLYSLASNRIR